MRKPAAGPISRSSLVEASALASISGAISPARAAIVLLFAFVDA